MKTPLRLIYSLSCLVFVLGLTACKIQEEESVNGSTAVEKLFRQMDKALLDDNYDAFASLWIEKGFKENLAGAGGYAGEYLYNRANKARWYPKPNFSASSIYQEDNIFFVPCEETLRNNGESMGTLYILVVNHKNKAYRFLGCSERSSSVKNLLERYIKDPSMVEQQGK